MARLALLIVGIVGLVIGLGTVVISLILVATQGGRVSGDEIMPVILGGGCCTLVSIVLAVVGLILFLGGRKKNAGNFPVDPTT